MSRFLKFNSFPAELTEEVGKQYISESPQFEDKGSFSKIWSATVASRLDIPIQVVLCLVLRLWAI